MKKSCIPFAFAAIVIALSLAAPVAAQEKADTAKVVGAWKIEVYTGDATYVLNLVITEENGQLAGKISEAMGSFTDAAVSEIYYDGVTFRFNFVGPTPPDGNSRTIKADFKVETDTMGGTISVPDLDVVIDAKGTRAQ